MIQINLFAEIIVFLFGAVLGSFINVLILRLPEDQSIGGRSHCTHCGHQLSAWDLVPILSYLALRGHCRYCGKKISPRYAIIETLCGFLLLAAFLLYPPLDLLAATQFIRAGFILLVLVIVFAVDYEHFLILDVVVFPSVEILLFLNLAVDFAHGGAGYLWNSLTISGLISAAALFAFFGAIYYVSGGRWMGFGDVKFALFLGLATPHPFVGVNLFISFLLGSYIGLILLLVGGKNMKSEIPFGTFLAASTAIILFFGPQLLDLYLRTIGLQYLATY